MSMGSESVDVIIPAYNAAPVIEAAIRSAQEQTSPPDRIIVVDDGSEDDTASVASALGPGVTVVRQPNAGPGSARGAGAALSSSGMLLFLDADDILRPEAIAKLRDALARHPKCAVAYCRAEPFSSSPGPRRRLDKLRDAEGDVWFPLLRGNFIRTPGCVLMRREVLIEAGGWDASLPACEDWALWLRLAELTPFVRVPQELLRYRVHAGTLSHDVREMYAGHCRVLRGQMMRQMHATASCARRREWPRAFRAGAAVLCMWPRCARCWLRGYRGPASAPALE